MIAMRKKHIEILAPDDLRLAIRYWLEQHRGYSKSIHEGKVTDCSRHGNTPLTITVEWGEKDSPEFTAYQAGSWKDEELDRTS